MISSSPLCIKEAHLISDIVSFTESVNEIIVLPSESLIVHGPLAYQLYSEMLHLHLGTDIDDMTYLLRRYLPSVGDVIPQLRQTVLVHSSLLGISNIDVLDHAEQFYLLLDSSGIIPLWHLSDLLKGKFA